MKKLLFTILFIFVCVNAYAVDMRFLKMMCAGSTSCSAVTDYVGYTTEGSVGSSATANRITVQLHTPTCTSGCTSGNIATAYIYHGTSVETGENVKVCIYSDDGDDIPNAGDNLIHCTGAITSTQDAEWRTAAVSGSNAITCANKYWVAHIAEGVFKRMYNSVGTYYYMASDYANPPATLDGTWSSTARTISIYFTVGP
jgi:hypothetical protein